MGLSGRIARRDLRETDSVLEDESVAPLNARRGLLRRDAEWRGSGRRFCEARQSGDRPTMTIVGTVKPAPFDYAAPERVDEVLSLLHEYQQDGRSVPIGCWR